MRRFSFSCEIESRYTLSIEYRTVAGKLVTPQIGVEFDFQPERVVDAPRIWQNKLEGERFSVDDCGNEQIPALSEVTEWRTVGFFSEAGQELSIPAGVHWLALRMIRESVEVRSIVLTPAESPSSYVDYRKLYGTEQTGKACKRVYEAELFHRKSHPEIMVSFDRTSPAVTPNDPVKIMYNTIGGSGYGTPGQWISWTVEVPENGWYSLDFQYRQNMNQGQISRRSLSIDGRIPFAECAEIEFPYCFGFENKTVSAGKEDAEFYLKKGRHEITLTVVTGSVSDTLRRLNTVVQRLNELYSRMILIVGETPNRYRDYDLDEHIDGLLDAFAQNADELERIIGSLMSDQKPNSTTAQIEQFVRLLRGFTEKPRKIAMGLDDYRSYINTLGTLITSLSTQPLELDSFTLRSATEKIEHGGTSLFELLLFRSKSFMASFAKEYDFLENKDGESLNVWMTTNGIEAFGFATGREQAQILTQMIRNDFREHAETDVRISLMGSDVLLQALVSGKGPDAALFVTETAMSNLYFRNALLDLSGMDGFDAVKQRFHPASLTALGYDGKLFALPEAQICNMMFYRTDIFEKYGFSVPQTWDDFYDVLSKLQIEGMQAGTGDRVYETLLFQNGGQLYRDDLSSTNMTEDASVQAFAEWTDLFTKRGMPLSYDALNRFRSGQIPLVINTASFYCNLSVGAPEINGLWAMAPIPGTKNKDGTIDRTSACVVSGAVIMDQSKQKENAWKFLKWWTDDTTQSEFAFECEVRFGVSARYFPANTAVLENMSWNLSERQALLCQRDSLQGLQQSPATYYLSRNLSNAFRRVVYEYENPRDVIYRYARDTDNELARKNSKLRIKGAGESLKRFRRY